MSGEVVHKLNEFVNADYKELVYGLDMSLDQNVALTFTSLTSLFQLRDMLDQLADWSNVSVASYRWYTTMPYATYLGESQCKMYYSLKEIGRSYLRQMTDALEVRVDMPFSLSLEPTGLHSDSPMYRALYHLTRFISAYADPQLDSTW
jgi:hypothetical protein